MIWGTYQHPFGVLMAGITIDWYWQCRGTQLLPPDCTGNVRADATKKCL